MIVLTVMINSHKREHLVLGAFFHSLSIDSDRFASHDEKVDDQTDDHCDEDASNR